ncbi:MAG: anaerobic carbon-monoxide dehydrogenase catalytic subunit [Nitrospirota bacterium]|jgi:carbon-monoxide dehydrogenase catalytic subunit
MSTATTEKKPIPVAEKSIDPGSQQLLEKARAEGISTMFDRVETMKPCPIGREGMCCKHCFMGPCRMVGKNKEEMTGICGASAATIAARGVARYVAAGTAAHSDHGRDLAFTLLAMAKGEAPGFKIKDMNKLVKVARIMDIHVDGRKAEEIALDVATEAIANFGRQTGELTYIKRAPKKRQALWKKYGIIPRGIDREVVELMHRTAMGVDQDPDSILMSAMRTALADGWGGAMLATDISDILFGTPKPVKAKVNLGVLKSDEVNIIVHGHEPTLSMMIVEASEDPEIVAYAKSKGAKGISLAGICCTANEILVRQGVSSAGNFLNQELAIISGAVEAMIVDVQCVIEALAETTKKFHTKLITTSAKARIPGAMHIEYDEHKALDIAKQIVKIAIDNFPNRKSYTIPDVKEDVVVGFSHEYIKYMQGGTYRGSFRPLNDAIMDGRIMGVVGMVGCNNPRLCQDKYNVDLVKKYIENDILVVTTGCAAVAFGKRGYLTPEMMEHAGPGLKEVCEAIGIPPVLHMGSCVDNSRILTVLSEMAEEGGLSDDIGGMPGVGVCAEWMHEKALAIGIYFAASGVPVIFGGDSIVEGSAKVTNMMRDTWFERLKGSLEFINDADKIFERTVELIKAARKSLKLKEYEPGKFAKEKVLLDMAARREIEKKEREEALAGV